jgi:uncharacterized protein YjbI with pentapeptide repeats
MKISIESLVLVIATTLSLSSLAVEALNINGAASKSKKCSTLQNNKVGECGYYPRMVKESADWYLQHVLGDSYSNGFSSIKSLKGGYFVNSELEEADLAFTNLNGTDFSGSNFELATFHRASCKGAKFEQANFEDATLTTLKCRNSNFDNANLSGASVTTGNYVAASFKSADLRNAELSFSDFTGADFTGADLRGADLTGANFTDATLFGAKLDASNLYWAVLIRSDLRCAKFGDAYWHEGSVTNNVRIDECTELPEPTQHGFQSLRK